MYATWKGRLWLSLFCWCLLSCGEKPSGANPDERALLRIPDSVRYKTAIWPAERIRNEIKDGDILLKRGEGSLSRIVVNVLNEEIPISHSSIAVREGDSLYLIHSLAGSVSYTDGVQSIELDSFLMDLRPYSFHILRHRDSEIAAKASEIARYYLSIQVPFDTDYLIEDDTTAFYCSEFVHKTWEDASGVGCFEMSDVGMGQILNFNSIFKHPDFVLINPRGSDSQSTGPKQKS